jgi:hypothetical protein
MAQGFVLSSGPWVIRQFDSLSTATFKKGDLLKFAVGRTVTAYASDSSSYVGIAMHDSVNSLPAGKVLVGIPIDGCTAYADVSAGITSSSLSFGHAHTVCQQGDHLSVITTLATSVWSKVVTIVGPIQSATSRIEVAFIKNTSAIWSTSSVSIV